MGSITFFTIVIRIGCTDIESSPSQLDCGFDELTGAQWKSILKPCHLHVVVPGWLERGLQMDRLTFWHILCRL